MVKATSRAFLLVMDSVGIGGAPDAAQYFNGDVPDTGANTLGHIAEACARGAADEGRSGPLHLPVMAGARAPIGLRLPRRARRLPQYAPACWHPCPAHPR